MGSHETLAILVMLNNFFHDLAVGILFANVVLTLILIRLLNEYRAKTGELVNKFARLSARITWGALAFIIVGGVIRTIAYRDFEWAEAAGKGQIAALVVKHIVLVACTVAGVGLQIRMSRRYKARDREPAASEREHVAC